MSSKFPISRVIRLFREATQRKTVGTRIGSAGVKPCHAKTCTYAISIFCRTRPVRTAAADESKGTVRAMAVARGGDYAVRRQRERNKFCPIIRSIRPVVHPPLVRAARSPDGPKAQRASPATLRVARAQPNSLPVRPRRAPSHRCLRALRNSRLAPKNEAGGSLGIAFVPVSPQFGASGGAIWG